MTYVYMYEIFVPYEYTEVMAVFADESEAIVKASAEWIEDDRPSVSPYGGKEHRVVRWRIGETDSRKSKIWSNGERVIE